MATTATGAPRTRRSTSEVRVLLLDAARECFEEKGYHATSTREIAQRAGVTEPMLFRHFGNKATLFERSVFDPFLAYIANYMELRWADKDTGTEDWHELAKRYIEGFYGLLLDNRDLLVVLLGEHSEDVEAPRSAAILALEAQFDAFGEQIELFTRGADQQLMDIGLAIRFSMSFIIGVALVDGYFFSPMGGHSDRAQFIAEMADFLLRAVTRG